MLHTAVDWLMLAAREAIPAGRDLARAEFATLQLRLLMIAVGAGKRQPHPAGLCLLLPGSGSRLSSDWSSRPSAAGSLALNTGAAVAPITRFLPHQRVPTFQTSPR